MLNQPFSQGLTSSLPLEQGREREWGREGKKKEPVVKVEVVSHLFNNRICYASSLCTSDVLDVQLDDHILPRYDISQIFPSGWNPVLFPLRITSSVSSCGI